MHNSEPVDRRLILAGAGLIGAAALSRIAKAGPLDPPPGPIQPTGRTLQEVHDKVVATSNKVAVSDHGISEPRVPIRSLPSSPDAQFVITQPGAYCLTDNIEQAPGVACISIECDHVDIDGQGFSFVGTAGSPPSSCIRAAGRQNLEIYDCSFRGWTGTCCDCDDCDDVSIYDCIFHACVSPANAATGTGGACIVCGDRCEIDDCDISLCQGCSVRTGASCACTHLRVSNCGANAPVISCAAGCCIDSCSVLAVTGVQGTNVLAIQCGTRCCVTECDIRAVSGVAISTGDDCVVECCEITGSGGGGGGGGGGGILCGARCCVEDSTCISISGPAISCAQHSSITECDCRGVSGGVDAVVSAGPGSVIECCEMTGCSSDVGGFVCADGCSVEDCTCLSHTGPAIRCGSGACVTECDCRDCVSGGTAGTPGSAVISVGSTCVVECCEVTGGSGGAIRCGDGCCVEDCTAMSHQGVAIDCGSKCSVSDCKSNDCLGVVVRADCTVCDCEVSLADGGGGAGGAITVAGQRCCISGNFVGNGGIVVVLDGDGALIEDNQCVGAGGTPGTGGGMIAIAQGVTRCHVRDNHVSRASTANAFIIPPGNSYGPIVNTIGGGDLSVIPNGNHPHGNFIYG